MYYAQDPRCRRPVAVAHSIRVVRFPVGRRYSRKVANRLTQLFFFLLFVVTLFGGAWVIAHFAGMDNLAQLHGGDHMIEALGIEQTPRI